MSFKPNLAEKNAMTYARNLASAGLVAVMLAACGTLAGKNASPAPGAKPLPDGIPRQTSPGADSESKIVSLPFRLDVSLTDAARTALRESNSEVGVAADYYGAPKDPAGDGLDPELGVWLGGEMEQMDPGQRSMTLKGQVDAARVAREVAGDARVKVTVFPVRAFGAPPDVTCTEFDEYLSIAVETGGTVSCRLRGE